MPRDFDVTSESVTEGHPDKMCDVISDAVLDACLKQDPNARVACEASITTLPVGEIGEVWQFVNGKRQKVDEIVGAQLLLAGEVTCNGDVDFIQAAVDALDWGGYKTPHAGFDWRSMELRNTLGSQSTDISQGVTAGEGLFTEQGAGDQGMMSGYACDETAELMPASHLLAQQLKVALSQRRRDGTLSWAMPDGKTQVTVRYMDGKPAHITKVVVSVHHLAAFDNHPAITAAIVANVIAPTLHPTGLFDGNTQVFVNPTGRFVIGGPHGDAGLTGRKIIVDTYGGHGGHGGGAFSGKDPSKVDRSAAYLARYIAKNLVAAGVCSRVSVQLAYAIGMAEPMSVMVDTFGTHVGGVTDERLADIVREVFPLKPATLIEHLQLKRPGYRECAAFGHFGHLDASPEAHGRFTWERTNMVDDVIAALGR